LQAAAHWPEADRLIAAIDNKVLLGHVQAQRYLHPRYRSRYQELTTWLSKYGDHPDAQRIHDLAMRRRPDQATGPAIPDGGGKPPAAGIKVSATEAPPERWNPAIEAFRQKRYGSAARRFEAIARMPKASPWATSAAAFWAARSHLLGGQPQQVNEWLHRAAQNPLTFYGLLARATLGIEGDLDLREPYLHQADARALTAQPAGARAIALLQINEPRRAEPELASVAIGDSSSLARAVVALANYGNMPGLSLRIGNRSIGLDNAERDAAIYPIPAWSPPGGFQVDRALMYAIMRRESSFNPDAHNNASGASGLMQLMPATAKAVAGRSMPISKIAEPETNLALGQKYLSRLLDDPTVGGNLIRLAAAYNAGPGNMAKWQRQLTNDDPLLFIESLPSRETRVFIETVLADHWIYRMRLGQKTDSLDALASGRWPMYVAQDRSDRNLAAAPQKSSAEATDAGH
jgi:soluble lytic murein transglycosylase